MRRQLTRCLPLAFLALFLGPGRASAKGFILITHGDTITNVGEIANPELKAAIKQKTGKDPSVGYKYSHFGVFWLDLWTWGGEYCVDYGDKTYEPLSASDAAFLLGVKESELGKPFLYRFPLGLLILVGCVAVFTPIGLLRAAGRNKVRRLFQDARYQKALHVMSEHSAKRRAALAEWEESARQARESGAPPPPRPDLPRDDGGFDEAVRSLVMEGIPHEEAEKNLNAMLQHIASQQAAG